jgi:signal transduction histidine kinase
VAVRPIVLFAAAAASFELLSPPPQPATASATKGTAAAPASKVRDLLRVMLAPFGSSSGFRRDGLSALAMLAAGRAVVVASRATLSAAASAVPRPLVQAGCGMPDIRLQADDNRSPGVEHSVPCRLRVESNARLAERRASRQRIVAAGDAERRRLERDLHDGAQQRLVAVALQLRLRYLACAPLPLDVRPTCWACHGATSTLGLRYLRERRPCGRQIRQGLL